jgi:hypothetical protein
MTTMVALVEVRCPRSDHLLFRAPSDRPLDIEVRCRCGRLLLVEDACAIGVLTE